MKIMHLCTGYPISFNGGITNYVRSIANTQAEIGIDTIVVGGKDKDLSDVKFRYIEYSDFYVKPFTLRSKKGIVAYNKIEKIIKKENPDLVHIHMILDVDRRLHKIFKKYNIKYVISLHDYNLLCPRIQMFRNNKPCKKVSDDCSKCANCIQQSFFLNKLYKTLGWDNESGKLHSPEFLKIFENNKILLENAELLLPVSKRVMEIYKNSGIKNKYKVLHIGNITADKFKKYKPKKRKENDLIKIIMLGNFSKIKGGEQFIKIVDNLDKNKFKFYFMGRSSKEEQEMMKSKNIIDKGSYKQVDLPNLLKEFDLGCVLSIWEDNAPQVVMELLNNNIPVIGTQMGGIPDFVKDNENGFLYDPYSEKSFNNLINRLNNIGANDVEKMKLTIKPTKTPEQHFKELNEIYEDILNNIK